MENLKNDLKYAIRVLMKNKGMAAAAILIIAVGIGFNTTIFSLVNAILINPLPYPGSDSIMSVFTSSSQKEDGGFSVANFLDLREQNKSFQAITAYGIWSYDVRGANEPELLTACRPTHGFFEVLNVKPLLGRTFLPDDEIEGKHEVVILTNSLWKRWFASDPSIIGKSIHLNGTPYQVVGVMPEKFAEPSFVDIWTPIVFPPELKLQRGASNFEVLARLKPGITKDQAQAELNTFGASLAKQYPQYNAGLKFKVVPTAEAVTGPIKPTLLIFWAAVIFVLLVACANLANLMLASTVSREREFALRISLGASPTRLRKQLLTETVFMALIGGSLGILFSLWAIPAFVALSPEDTPRLSQVTMNGTVLVFSILLSALTGIVFGLAPAFSVAKHNLARFLKEGTFGGGTGRTQIRFRNLLVTGQIAVVLVLLVGAGLMIRSFEKLQAVDPGFNPERLLNLQIFLPHTRYRELDTRRAFTKSMLENVRTVPQIQAAAIASPAPFESIPHLIDTGFRVEGQPPLRPGNEPVATFNRVTEDFFKTMQIPIRKGRAFLTTDHDKSTPVAIVNDALEKRFWPEKGAIGQRIIVGVRKPVTFEIVGVVSAVKQLSLSSVDPLQIYVPYNQSPSGAISIIVRTQGEPKYVISALKTQLWAVDPTLPAKYLSTAEELVSQSLHRPRSNTVLLTLFAGMAFLLAMIGVYSVIAYSVSQRTREIGVRISLGAQRSEILKMILSQGMRLIVFGIAAGIIGALALTHLISSLLFNVSSQDPLIFSLGAFLMIIISLIACYIPARRAMKVDPVVALRYE
jgi:putative ABC transport system permease protein